MSELNKMKPQLKSSAAARALIKRFEPFNGMSIRAADGRWVIGYGHRAAAKPGAEVTPEEADLLLIYDVLNAETAIDDVVNTPLKTPQRDALVSFVHDIGGDAFKRSDVARYLFEGRAMAAGEALAIYGDTNLDRREAENTLFMTAFAPPASKRAEEREQSTVELVIKVEHPEPDLVETPATAPALAEASGDDALPPPPPSARDIAARRAAEDEISRILVAVGEMPLEVLQPESDTAPEPVEATPPVAPEIVEDLATSDDTPDIIAEIEVVEALVEPEPAADQDTEDTPEDAPGSETETAVEEVQLDAVDVRDPANADAADNPASEEQAPAEAYDRSADVSFDMPNSRARRSVFDSYGSSPLTALMPAPRVSTMPDPETVPSSAEAVSDTPAPEAADEADEPTADSPAASIPLSAVQDAVDTDPVDEAVHAFDVPAEVSEDAAAQTEAADGSDPAAAQVIARMSQEIAAQVEPVEQQRGRASVHSYDESLPEGATLGFVIAGELAAHFDDEPAPETTSEAGVDAEVTEPASDDTDVEQEFARLAEVMTEEEAAASPEPALEAVAEPEAAPEMSDEPRFIAPAETADSIADPVAEDASSQDEPIEIAEPQAEAVAAQEDVPAADAGVSEQAETGEVEAAEPVAETAETPDTIVAQVHDVVEHAIAVAGQDSPPPHPSFEAAEASGAVGEVGADETLSRAPVHVEDELVDTREIAELEDDFSPADLAGEDDLYTDTRTIEPHKDRSAGWFILVLLAGLTLSVYGGLFTYLEWDRVWGARELTSGAWALIAGSFFSVMALWQLLSIWAEKRKEKAPI